MLPRVDDGVMASLLPKKQPEGEIKFRCSRHSEGAREQAAASTKQQKEKRRTAD
jgi:hypothetical protein